MARCVSTERLVAVAAVRLLSHPVPGLSDDFVATLSHTLMYLGMLLAMVCRSGEYVHVRPHAQVAPP